MKIVWSEEALQALRGKLSAEPAVLRLVYDTEGCGCAVNGVPALWAVDAPLAGDVRAEGTSPYPVWYEKDHAIFFDDELRIAYNPDSRAFSLASDGQIYTNRLAVIDRRSAAAKQA